MNTLQNLLLKEYQRRKEKNSRYSLRSFAKSLDMNSGTISQIFSGKRSLSEAKQKKLMMRLGHFELDEIKLVETKTERLEMDQFILLADPKHFVLLECFELAGFKDDISWYSAKTGLSSLEILAILNRLERVGLIKKTERGLRPTKKNLSTLHVKITTKALKDFQREVLAQAIDAIDNVDVDLRDQSTLTVAIPKKNISKIKKRITEFRREINAWASEQSGKDEVYQLTVSLFPTKQNRSK